MRIRKLLILFCVAILSIGIFAPEIKAYADLNTQEVFGKGSWNGNEQGIRFSIYDTVNCETLRVLDLFRGGDNSHDGTPYGEFLRRIVNNTSNFGVKLCYGSKLDYLYQYQIEKKEKLSQLELKYFEYFQSQPGKPAVWSYDFIPNSDNMAGYLEPIYSNTDGTVMVACDSFRLIMQKYKSVVEKYILNPMGYTMHSDRISENLIYLEDYYILSAEPVYYFLNGTGPSENKINWFYFYGTATEFAIWDRHLDAKGAKLWNNGYSPMMEKTLANQMGTLTLHVAPLAIMPQYTRLIPLYGDELNEDGTVPPGTECIRIESPNNAVISRGESVADSDIMIVKQYGVETMTRGDFDELTVDITEENTVFRTGTKGVISFKITSSGVSDFSPPLEDMLEHRSTKYGLRLELTTLDSSIDSGKSMPSMSIRCDGLPSTLNGETGLLYEVSTMAYKNFSVPKTPGIWRFTVDVYSAQYGSEDYASTNGIKDEELKKYYFEIKFEDSNVVMPPDTSASDKRPADFTGADFDINMVSFTAPATFREWGEYVASIKKDKETGEQEVVMKYKTTLLTAGFNEQYVPVVYKNVSEKFKNGMLQTRAGYGIGLEVTANGSAASGFQTCTAMFPEFNYRRYGVTLEKTGNIFKIEENPNSMYYNDPAHGDYSRVHFTPVWYPDGEYEIAVFLYDNWTPVGQLWDYRTYKINISGTIYDDWYITRR